MRLFQERTHLDGSPFSALLMTWGRRSRIKSIQRSTITISNGNTTGTATITGVVLANSILHYLGNSFDVDNGINAKDCIANLTFTNTTTITATRIGTTGNIIASFEVIEYFPGVIKSIQRGEFTLASVASANQTITAVDVTKSDLSWLGTRTDDANVGAYMGRALTNLQLANSTTITANRGIGTNAVVVAYQVAEYY